MAFATLAASLQHMNEILVVDPTFKSQQVLRQMLPLVRSYLKEFEETSDQDGMESVQEESETPVDMEAKIMFDLRAVIDVEVWRKYLIYLKKINRAGKGLIDSCVDQPKVDLRQMMELDGKEYEGRDKESNVYRQAIRDMLQRHVDNLVDRTRIVTGGSSLPRVEDGIEVALWQFWLGRDEPVLNEIEGRLAAHSQSPGQNRSASYSKVASSRIFKAR